MEKSGPPKSIACKICEPLEKAKNYIKHFIFKGKKYLLQILQILQLYAVNVARSPCNSLSEKLYNDRSEQCLDRERRKYTMKRPPFFIKPNTQLTNCNQWKERASFKIYFEEKKWRFGNYRVE